MTNASNCRHRRLFIDRRWLNKKSSPYKSALLNILFFIISQFQCKLLFSNFLKASITRMYIIISQTDYSKTTYTQRAAQIFSSPFIFRYIKIWPEQFGHSERERERETYTSPLKNSRRPQKKEHRNTASGRRTERENARRVKRGGPSQK